MTRFLDPLRIRMSRRRAVNHFGLDPEVYEKCFYCGIEVFDRLSDEAFKDQRCAKSRDHITPKCDDGEDIVIACSHCNGIKGSDPADVYIAFMRVPHTYEDRPRAYRAFRNALMLKAIDLLGRGVFDLSGAAKEEPANNSADYESSVFTHRRWEIRHEGASEEMTSMPPRATRAQIIIAESPEARAKKILDTHARAIGRSAVNHLKEMYPEAMASVARSAEISLTNHIRNKINHDMKAAIMALVDIQKKGLL